MAFSKDQSADEADCVFGYRLVAPKWASTALSGEGARLYGGRWNSPGRPMVYLSMSRALSALEQLVHLPTPESRRIPRVILTVKIPTELIGGEFWPEEGWRDDPPGKGSTDQGDDWLLAASTVGVFTPSAIIPEEKNLLLNPLHPDFQKVVIIETKPFSFDPRLLSEKSQIS